jgi:sarcosine oxidase subunit beta
MADAIVIGGGIVGASAAWQLAELGAEVTLLERGALASGATARSQGLLLPPDHETLMPVFDETIRLYRRLAAETDVDFALDAEPIGTLMLATTEEQLAELRANPDGGVLLDHDEVLREEPALAPHIIGGLLYPEGFRTDPGALTAAAAAAARAAGATVRTHVEVKRVTRGRVVTDEGTFEAATILLCAGAWTRALARALGHDVQVRPVRGWLAVTAPSSPLLRHVIYEAGYAAPAGPQPGTAVSVADLATTGLATAGAEPSHAFAAHQNADGTIMIGASRSAALRETDESADALRLSAAAALGLIPSLATHEVATTWTGLRPFSHDDRPYIGWLEEGVAVCAGHGSEGVLTGGGSGRLIAQIVAGEPPYVDPAPFRPDR